MPAAQRTTYLQALVGNLVRPPLLLSRHAVERESTSEGACERERESYRRRSASRQEEPNF